MLRECDVDFGVERSQRRHGERRVRTLAHRLRRRAQRHRVVRWRDGHRQRPGGHERCGGIGHPDLDDRPGRGVAEFDIGGLEDQAVHPGGRLGCGASEAERAGGRSSVADRQPADNQVRCAIGIAINLHHDGDVAHAAVRDVPSAQRRLVGAGCVQRAVLGHRQLGGRGSDRRRREQALVIDIVQHLRFDLADRAFQRPVAALHCGARCIGRGGHIGARQGGHPDQQRIALSRDIAAVQQDVAVCGEARADGRPLRGMFGNVVRRDDAVAERDLPGRAVADDLQGADVGAAVQRSGQLCNAVRAVVDQDHLAARRQRLHHLLPVDHALVHHVHRVRRGGGCRRLAGRRCGWRIRHGLGGGMGLGRRRMRRFRMGRCGVRGVWRVGRMGRFHERGAVEKLAAFECETM